MFLYDRNFDGACHFNKMNSLAMLLQTGAYRVEMVVIRTVSLYVRDIGTT